MTPSPDASEIEITPAMIAAAGEVLGAREDV
jgi:hypothetical protein